MITRQEIQYLFLEHIWPVAFINQEENRHLDTLRDCSVWDEEKEEWLLPK